MRRTEHATEIAKLVLRDIDGQPARLARRLLLPQLRWLAAEPDEQQATACGVRELVERARDEHLASLDADEGLAALRVPWDDVVRAGAMLAERSAPRRCPRCGARLPRRRHVCARCRRPSPR